MLGYLPQAANSVGADVLGVNSGESVAEMASAPKQAVLLLNVEPEIDTADGAKAVAALKQAKSVMAFTPFVSETLLDVCDVLLPIAPFTETSGSFIKYGRPSAIFPRRGTRLRRFRVRCGKCCAY